MIQSEVLPGKYFQSLEFDVIIILRIFFFYFSPFFKRSSGFHQNSKKKLNQTDHLISSPSLPSSMSSYSSGRNTIDAQTYVDAQSNGLTKRIVRYDEENKKTPKLYNRIYKRPGDFPIVHLDKPKLVLTPKRSFANPPKMPRIGQPDPSINRTNVRAEILRNGTMMPQISIDRREDVDSVRVDPLDALKEISRKRIHCEVSVYCRLPFTVVTSTKHYTTLDQIFRFQDTINQIQSGPAEKDSTDSITSGIAYNDSKRQRIATWYLIFQNFLFISIQQLFNSSANDTSTKRNTSKCNEILSSLSSSSYMVSPPSLKRAEATSPSSCSIISPQTKRLQTDKPIEAPTIDLTVNSVPKPVEKVVVAEVDEKSCPTESTRPKLLLFNRPHSANSPVLAPVSNRRKDECQISFVKPRPMTARSRESVENWLKIKPDEKRRLSLMLSCLSGEVDDSDTVDSKEKVIETPKSSNTVASNENSSKQVDGDRNASQHSIPVTVTSSAQTIISSTTTSLLPSIPAITFSPISSVNTTTLVSLPLTTVAVPLPLPTATIAPTSPKIEERKGGFSFPLATKESPQTTIPPASTLSTTVLVSASTAMATVTPTVATASTNIISKDSSATPSVSFTFHPPKPQPNPTLSVATTTVEPTKTFTFGSITNEPKTTTPVFGSLSTQTTNQVTSGTSVQPTNQTSFTAFGQTSSNTIGNVDFTKTTTMPASTLPNTVASSTTSIFGTMTSSNAFSKVQPQSFGAISTTQQTISNNKPIQSNPVFGSAFSNTQNQIDPKTSSATATSFTSNQLMNPTATTTAIGSTNSFAFGGASTNASAFKTAQAILASTSSPSFGNKPINSTTNIFGPSAPQASTATPIFGSSVNTNLFDQTPKVGSIQNSAESEKNVAAQNIFGSSTAAKPPATFTFSASNQPNANNIFGGQTTAGSGSGNAFNFGGSNQKTEKSDSSASNLGTTNKSFTFSGNSEATKPIAFGSKSVAPTFGTSNVTDSAKSGGFAANNQTNSTNLFNNKSTNEVPKVFSFGGTGNTQAGTNAAGTFGGGASGMPAFGGTNATPSFGGNNGVPAFGGASTFGSTNSTPSFGNSPNATPIFGTTNPSAAFGGNSTFGTTNATPSFGAIKSTQPFGGSNVTPVFGANTGASAFGGNNGASAFGSTTSFGSGATQAFNANTPSFGSNLNNSNSSGFSGNNTPAPAFTTSTGTADINKSFNFTGNDQAPSPVPNLFNIGPGTSPAPRGRTIRTATRRTYR